MLHERTETLARELKELNARIQELLSRGGGE
jgi:hypothetical protein